MHTSYMEKKKFVAEFLGTFAVVFCGTGAMVINAQTSGAVGHVGVAITFGLIVTSMIYALGDISGAHMNPAVTVAFFVDRRFSGNLVLPYVISQLAGAAAASSLLHLLFPADELLGATRPAGSDVQSFILELILTFFLMLVILRVADGSNEKGLFAGLAIGMVVLLEAMFAGPICGASMNPARSFGPALVTMNWTAFWLYVTAPIVGALSAVGVNRFMFER